MNKEQERKRLRKEKQLKFQEELMIKRGYSKNKNCKITKGEHIYNVPAVIGIGRWIRYNLVCACGKKTWNIPDIYPLHMLPQFTVCQKHGYLQGKQECWACKLNLDSFEH